jgi:hypothetical protein
MMEGGTSGGLVVRRNTWRGTDHHDGGRHKWRFGGKKEHMERHRSS